MKNDALISRLRTAFEATPDISVSPDVRERLMSRIHGAEEDSVGTGVESLLHRLKVAYRETQFVSPTLSMNGREAVRKIEAFESEGDSEAMRAIWRGGIGTEKHVAVSPLLRSRLIATIRERTANVRSDPFWDRVIRIGLVATPVCAVLMFVSLQARVESRVPVLVIFQENEGF